MVRKNPSALDPKVLPALHKQFDPFVPLHPGDPRYVETAPERGVPTLLKDFEYPLLDEESAPPLLFCGHTGDGKTTTLNYLRKRLEDQGHFVAFGDAMESLDPNKAEYETVILMLLAVVDRALRETYQETVREPWYKERWDDFCRMAKLPAALKFDIKVPLGPYVKLSTTVKDTPDVGDRVRQGLRRASSASLQEVVNAYFDRARTVIRAEGRRDLIAILDGLEKIPSESKTPKGIYRDEEIFVGNSTQLTALRCKVVYTVRLALARSRYDRLKHDYGPPIIVPMLPVRRRLDGGPNPAGLERLAEIVRARVEAAGAAIDQVLGPEDVVRGICAASGGHPRELMMLIQALIRHGDQPAVGFPIPIPNIEKVIHDAGADRRESARGYEKPLKLVSQHYSIHVLAADDSRKLGELQQELLRKGWVYEYFDGDYWHDVCPQLSPLLEEATRPDSSTS